jgi:nucleotide-binding universal stress UspA family protein
MAGGRYKKIVVPLDGSGWSETALPHAIDIARSNDSEIVLLHIFKAPAHEYLDTMALAGQDAHIQEVRENVKQKFIGLRNELREQGINVRVQWIEGVGVANLVCDYVREEGADLVVMTSHGYTGLARFLFGSVANQIIQGVDVPVMIIRPGKE